MSPAVQTGKRSFLACPGHAVYGWGRKRKPKGRKPDAWEKSAQKDARWSGGYPGEGAVYYRHVHDAVRIAPLHGVSGEGYGCLILSGGTTRTSDKLGKDKRTEVSEAEGMLALGIDMGWFREEDGKYYLVNKDTPMDKGIPVLLETYARDSFENLLFSLLRFHQEFKAWPVEGVGVLSWPWKSLRYHFAAQILRIPDMLGDDNTFQFYGSGQLARSAFRDAVKNEAGYLFQAIEDPLHRGNSFAGKRRDRTPGLLPGVLRQTLSGEQEEDYRVRRYDEYWNEVIATYAVGPEAAEIREALEEMRDMQPDPAPTLAWPWPSVGQ